jgi:hypothetical protein
MSKDISLQLGQVSGFDMCDLLESSGVLTDDAGFVLALSLISLRCRADPSIRQDLGKI